MKFIPNAASAKVALTVLKTQKHSPAIMFGAGVVGVVATAVLASRATLKGAEIIAEHKADRVALEEIDNERYSREDLVKDKALLLSQTSLKIAKLYAPAVVIGVGSIGLLTGSHVMLTRRNAAATAAYATIDKAYREYRNRVKETVGEEAERELYRNVTVEKVVEVDETGKKKQVSKKVIKDGSDYSVFYSEVLENDEMNPNWQEFPELNVLWLRNMQNQFNKQLQANGFLFLGDVLKEMHLPRTGELGKAAQSVGWVKKTAKNADKHRGDGIVDFGIFADENMDTLFDFTTGHNDGIWLNFNVDGVILDQI